MGLSLGLYRRLAVLGLVSIALISAGCGMIDPPKDWIEAEAPPEGVLAIFYNPEPDTYEELEFTAKITIVAEEAPDLTLEEYIGSSDQLIPSLVPDPRSSRTSVSELNGQPAYFVDTTFQQGTLPLRSLQLCVERDDKFYVITAMALEPHWDKYADVFERSLMSFSS